MGLFLLRVLELCTSVKVVSLLLIPKSVIIVFVRIQQAELPVRLAVIKGLRHCRVSLINLFHLQPLLLFPSSAAPEWLLVQVRLLVQDLLAELTVAEITVGLVLKANHAVVLLQARLVPVVVYQLPPALMEITAAPFQMVVVAR